MAEAAVSQESGSNSEVAMADLGTPNSGHLDHTGLSSPRIDDLVGYESHPHYGGELVVYNQAPIREVSLQHQGEARSFLVSYPKRDIQGPLSGSQGPYFPPILTPLSFPPP